MKGMTETKLFAGICAVSSLFCLFAGYGLKGYWAILVLFPAASLYWFLMKKVSARITISILFFVYVLLMVIGLLTGISPYLMLIGNSCALVEWESAQFLSNFQGEFRSSADPRLEHIHTRDLTIAVGSGLLLSLFGLNVHLRLPFGVIAILSLIAVYGVYKAFRLASIHN